MVFKFVEELGIFLFFIWVFLVVGRMYYLDKDESGELMIVLGFLFLFDLFIVFLLFFCKKF